MTNALTAENMKTLRNAEDIVFRYNSVPGEDAGTTVIECIKRTDPGDGFGDRDIRVQIEVAGTRIRNYTGSPWAGENAQRQEVASMNWVLGTAQYNDVWRTIVQHILRTNDHVWLELLVSNNSETLRSAGLAHDELQLMVERKTGERVKTFTFKLTDAIYPIHAGARPVALVAPATYTLNP